VKRIKLVRETKPKSDPNAQPKTFYMRHDRFFTFLGTLIIFLTFVIKEGISDSLKDLVGQLDAAQNIFVIRQDLAFSLNNGKPWSPLPDGQNPTNEQKIDTSNLSQLQTEPLLEIARDLASSLPDRQQFSERADAIESDLSDLPRLKAPTPGSPRRKDYDTVVENLYSKSNDVFTRASVLRHEVFEQAQQLKEKREKNYKIAKWISYFLFAFGWSLTFYGQMSGRPPEGSKLPDSTTT
jgi:hypothetical protein